MWVAATRGIHIGGRQASIGPSISGVSMGSPSISGTRWEGNRTGGIDGVYPYRGSIHIGDSMGVHSYRDIMDSNDRVQHRQVCTSIATHGSSNPSTFPVHWVPEQSNIRAGACNLIDGCSLELCLTTHLVAQSGICYRNKVTYMTISCGYITAYLYRILII